MYRVLEVGPTGPAIASEGDQNAAPPPEGVFRWIDLEKQDAAQLSILSDRFQFHPLTVEDCDHFDQRPKLEEYGDHLFLVTHGFLWQPTDDEPLKTLELHTFLGNRYLVTVHAEPFPAIDRVWTRLCEDASIVHRGSAFISYLVIDSIVDSCFPLLDDLTNSVEDIEDRILGGRHVELVEIFRLKRQLVQLRKVLSPQRDVFALLAKRGDGWIDLKTSLYFRDVYDHLLRIHEWLEGTRDLLGNALDAYLWSASQRTNEIMKRLTLLSAVFMPLSFITGFWGQNFQLLPFDSAPIMYLSLTSCALVPIAMIYFFMRSKWF